MYEDSVSLDGDREFDSHSIGLIREPGWEGLGLIMGQHLNLTPIRWWSVTFVIYLYDIVRTVQYMYLLLPTSRACIHLVQCGKYLARLTRLPYIAL